MDRSNKRQTFVPERPSSAMVAEPKNLGKYLPRPTLQIKRYSSPPGTLQLSQAFCQHKDLPRERAPSPDIGRRSGLSRKHYYGSLEALNSLHCSGNDVGENPACRFRMENGEIATFQNGTVSRQGSGVHLENPEFQTRWYFKYFLGKVHQNFVGVDGSKSPFILSVCLTDADNYGVPQYRAIVWRKTGSQKLCIAYHPNKPVSPKTVLRAYGINKVDKGPKEVLNAEIQKELLVLEEQEGSVNFKFGIVYAKQGQTTDDEVFSNVNVSVEFERFLELLGERIELRGWQKYRGGLDVKNDMTGSHSLYTMYEGHEVMFHVSTMLPFTPDNPQQVERKRHIGNDIVIIVFQDWDEKTSFSPPAIKSKFVHIYALVSYNKSDASYRVTVFSEKNVPIFGPPLPCPPVFRNHQEFRDFLLVKLMNGEKAAYASPTFSNRRQRTLDSLITRLLQDHMHEKLGARKSWNDVLDSSRGNRRKGMEREEAFLQFGQSLKLKTIVKGDAPTSLASTSGNAKIEPWEPQCIFEDFPTKVFCGDSWGNSLVLGTEDGIQILQGSKHRYMFDKSVVAKQMSIVEAFGLLLFRVDKGKEFHSSKLYVFRLADFEDEDEDEEPKSRAFCRNHRVEKSRGCHLFSVSQSGEGELRLAVAVGKKVILLRWKHSAVWSTWSLGNNRNVAEGFDTIKEVTLGDAPSLMTLVYTSCHESLVCVGYKHQFDLISEAGDVSRIHCIDKQKKATLVSAVDVYEEEESELLISFNHQSIFKRLTGEQSSSFAFQWNSAPNSVVCAFPYLLAFTTNTIEIRLVVNANLVHTLVIPKVCLISAKADIYFSACPPNSSKSSIQATLGAGPASPVQEKTSLYKISTISLMGQFLDPPLARKPQLVVSASSSNGKNANEEELSISEVIAGKRDNSSKEAVDATGIDTNLNSKGSTDRTTSCAEARKVSEPTDPRGAVKYSGNLSWTTV